MKTKIILPLLALALLAGACTRKAADAEAQPAPGASALMKGDKTLYGLACEGCTDSVVVFLPSDDSDPVTFDIIRAKRRGRVLGRIQTGDWIAVVRNPRDASVADEVIDLDELKGIWCYIVMPKMRDYKTMSKRHQAKMMEDMSDSLKETFLIPREYGFWLKRQWVAQSVGYVQEASSLADESPVVYPPLGYFVNWHIWNGKFVMVSGTPTLKKGGNEMVVTNLKYDTCSIDYLSSDSLVLTDRDGSRSYYKKSDVNDLNKRARAIAAMRSKQALEEATKE